jgi:hypothetical protein
VVLETQTLRQGRQVVVVLFGVPREARGRTPSELLRILFFLFFLVILVILFLIRLVGVFGGGAVRGGGGGGDGESRDHGGDERVREEADRPDAR